VDQKIKGGTKIQLALYLRVARQLYPGKHPQEARYEYFTAKGGYSLRTYGTPNQEEVRILDETLGKVLATVDEGTHRGFFAPTAGMRRSTTTSHCRNCEFRDLCGTGMEDRAHRKAIDPRAEDYYAMRDIE
jgi:hypothetical protein